MTVGDPPWWMNQWVQQGWQCPVCQRVYSPTTAMCFYCPPKFSVQPNTQWTDPIPPMTNTTPPENSHD